MINIFTFLTLLLLFVRIYSLVSLLFLSEKRVQFAERITVFILLFEVLTIFLYTFFTYFLYFRFYLPDKTQVVRNLIITLVYLVIFSYRNPFHSIIILLYHVYEKNYIYLLIYIDKLLKRTESVKSDSVLYL